MQSVCRPGLVNGLPVFSLWKVRKFSEIKCNLTQCNSILGATKARGGPLSRSAGLTSTLLYRPACSCLLTANAYASPCTWLLLTLAQLADIADLAVQGPTSKFSGEEADGPSVVLGPRLVQLSWVREGWCQEVQTWWLACPFSKVA